MAQFRAVEHRRFLVRAANSGISAIVDPRGVTTEETPLLAPATIAGDIRWMHSRTVFERTGEAPSWLAACALAVFCVVPRNRRRTVPVASRSTSAAVPARP